MVEELKSVREIYEGLSPSLRDKPFVIRRGGLDGWRDGTFFVVRRVVSGGSRMGFFGDLYRGGQLIRRREGDLLPLSFACVWVLLPYSTVVCVAVEAGICPMYEEFCERVRKCSALDEWILRVVRASDVDDAFEDSEL